MRKGMRYAVLAAVLISGLVALPASAKRYGSFSVPENCQVQGQNLPAGNYDLSWKHLGDDRVEVKFYRGSTLVATGHGTLVQNQPPVSQHALVLRGGRQGAMDVVELRFAGSTDRIQFSRS